MEQDPHADLWQIAAGDHNHDDGGDDGGYELDRHRYFKDLFDLLTDVLVEIDPDSLLFERIDVFLNRVPPEHPCAAPDGPDETAAVGA